MSDEVQVEEGEREAPTLAEVRCYLVAAESELREASYALKTIRAAIEQEVIEADDRYATLKNEPDRTRFLLVEIGDNPEYVEAVDRKSRAEDDVASYKAALQVYEDTRRDLEFKHECRDLDLRARALDIDERALAIRETEAQQAERAMAHQEAMRKIVEEQNELQRTLMMEAAHGVDLDELTQARGRKPGRA